MFDNGYVYALINPSFPNLIKVGKTTRNPEERALELSSSTSAPTPFIVVYQDEFNDCSKAEAYVHAYLEEKGFRQNPSREFFEAPIKIVLDAIYLAKSHDKEIIERATVNEGFSADMSTQKEDEFLDSLSVETDPEWLEFHEKAEGYYYGFEDTLQDYEEALKYYKKAILLGSPCSCLKPGVMLIDDSLSSRPDYKSALEFFKEGVKRGDVRCYAEMAKLFYAKEQHDNAMKCWSKVFKSEQFINNSLYENSSRASIVNEYIFFSILKKEKIQFIEYLRPVKEEVIAHINNAIGYAEKMNDKEYIQSLRKRIQYVNAELS